MPQLRLSRSLYETRANQGYVGDEKNEGIREVVQRWEPGYKILWEGTRHLRPDAPDILHLISSVSPSIQRMVGGRVLRLSSQSSSICGARCRNLLSRYGESKTQVCSGPDASARAARSRHTARDNQGYRIWNFPALGRGRRLTFRPLWSSLGRRDALVRRKLDRRGSNAIALPGQHLYLDSRQPTSATCKTTNGRSCD
jgi:hypothetical protein